MRSSSLWAALAALISLSTSACVQEKDTDWKPPGSCSNDAPCTNPVSGGGSTSGGADGGPAVGVQVTGDVGLLSTLTFNNPTGYDGAATVFATASDGTTVSAPFGGSSASTFTLDDVRVGPQWFFVRDDTSGATDVYSTYTPITVPEQPGPLLLYVVDRPTLQAIAFQQPGSPQLSPNQAQVILFLERDDMPAQGVALAGDAGGAIVLYDEGTGEYSQSATVTGASGRMVLLNVPVPADGVLSLNFDTGTPPLIGVDLAVEADAATIARVTLPK